MSSCCDTDSTTNKTSKKSKNYLLKISSLIILISYIIFFVQPDLPTSILNFTHDVVELMNKMWIGLAFAIIFVGVLDKIPREIVMGVLGTNRGINGILRATAGGLLLDLCNHGILVVGMKLYERGASLGQILAFLIASPWNSFSMTLILISLIGWGNTLLFIVLSCVIAVFSGLIFEYLVRKKVLPENENQFDLPEDLEVWKEIKLLCRNADYSLKSILNSLTTGFKSSQSILKWIFFGAILAATLRSFLSPDDFHTYLGPSLLGLGLTIIGATIIEVCSEGSAPIAADLVNLGLARGNGFTFLMTGVSTDYTEIMSLKETTKSWKIALFLPLISVPQIIFIGYILNQWTV